MFFDFNAELSSAIKRILVASHEAEAILHSRVYPDFLEMGDMYVSILISELDEIPEIDIESLTEEKQKKLLEIIKEYRESIDKICFQETQQK